MDFMSDQCVWVRVLKESNACNDDDTAQVIILLEDYNGCILMWWACRLNPRTNWMIKWYGGDKKWLLQTIYAFGWESKSVPIDAFFSISMEKKFIIITNPGFYYAFYKANTIKWFFFKSTRCVYCVSKYFFINSNILLHLYICHL